MSAVGVSAQRFRPLMRFGSTGQQRTSLDVMLGITCAY